MTIMMRETIRRALATRQARRLGLSVLSGLAVAALYVLIAPRWYQATLTVVPALPNRPGVGAQIAGALGSVADLPLDLGNNADVERIAAILASNSVTDAVINKFDLTKRYRSDYIELTRKRVWTLCSTHIDRKAHLVSLSCEDRDPKLVTAMLEYFGDFGNKVFRRVSTSSATEEVHFLEQRVADMRKEADEAAERLRLFEEQHKIVDLESQSKAVVSALASLRGQQISKDLELSYLNTFSSREETTASQLRQQLAVIDAKFRTMEEPTRDGPSPTASGAESRRAARPGGDVFPAALSVPGLRFQLEQLYRDRKIRETNLVLLMQRLEMARVNEARDTSAFQILDHPVEPTFRSRPRPSVVLTLGFILGLLLGVAWVYAPGYLREMTKAASSA